MSTSYADPGAPPLSSVVPLVDVLERLLPGTGVRRRVHVVSGSFGAGHDAAAYEIERRLTARGHEVARLDVVDLFPARLGRVVRWLYPLLLRVWPASWGLVLGLLQPGRSAHRLVTWALGSIGRALLATDAGADLFVSTHPFASQALGRLRQQGALAAPVVTYLTDASVHPLWVHPGVDLHVGLHGPAARAVRRLGGTAEVVEPLVPDVYAAAALDLAARERLRRSLGLLPGQRLALVVGGSMGIGRLRETASEIRDTGRAVPVVVCGRNRRLAARLGDTPGVVALGWREDLPDLVRAADCVVQNAGGFTAWEALAAGTPVVTYRSIPGHGIANAAALEEAGLVPWARDLDQLDDVLDGALAPARAWATSAWATSAWATSA